MWKQLYSSICCCPCSCFQRRGQGQGQGQGQEEKVTGVNDGINRTTYDNKAFSSDNVDSRKTKDEESKDHGVQRFPVTFPWSESVANIKQPNYAKEKHPLQNSLILSKIFSHLVVKDLFSCRLVNRQWNAESSKLLRNKGDPIWIQSVDLPHFLKVMKKSRDNPFTRYALNLTDSSSSAFSISPGTRTAKLKINGNEMNKNQNNRISMTRQLLQSLGSHILMLIIQCYELDLPFHVENLGYARNVQSLLLIICPEKLAEVGDIEINGNESSSYEDGLDFETQNSASPLRKQQKQIVRAQWKMGKFRNSLKLPKLTEVRLIKSRENGNRNRNNNNNNRSSRIRGHRYGQDPSARIFVDMSKCVLEILNSSSSIKIIDLKQFQFLPETSSQSSSASAAVAVVGMNDDPVTFDPLKNIFIQCSSTFQKVSYLTLDSVTEAQLKCVSSVASHLKSLEIQLKKGVEDLTLFEIFNRNANSLESLLVSNEDPNGVFYFPMKMSTMKTIVLKRWKGPILVDSIVLNCPNLEKLDFENFNPDNIVVHSFQFKHDALDRLGLLLSDGELIMFPKRKIKGLYKRLLPQFPNVKDFYSAAETDDILQLIFTSINHRLDSIYLDCSMEVSDASLTGIPIEVLEAIQAEQIHRLSCGCWVFKDVTNFRKNPYLGSLSHLTQFHVSIEPGAQITNLSLHHGVADLKFLQVLRLHAKDFRWCLECIADNLPRLEKLYLKSKKMYHVDDMNYLRGRLPSLEIEFILDSENSYFSPRASARIT